MGTLEKIGLAIVGVALAAVLVDRDNKTAEVGKVLKDWTVGALGTAMGRAGRR